MQALQQQLMIRLWLRVSGKNEQPAVGGRQVNVNHLDGAHLLDYRTAGQPRGQGSQALLQCDVQTVSQEGNEDVSLDARVLLMVDGPDGQIALESAKGCLDLGQLDVALPQDCRVFIGEV